MMAAVAAVEWLCGRFLLPGVKLYVLLILGSHVVKEPLLTRAAKLLEKCVGWSLKTLLGLVVGLQFLQSMILPYADSVGRRGIWQFVKMIPGLGQGAGAAAQMVLGAGVLVKNAIGGAAMVVLAVISLLPVIKLAVLMVMYHLAAAVMQPVCDRRMVSCVAGAARGQELLLQIVLYALFVFILAVAITCVSTNTGYLAA
jgi:stage III sporulation protein AE